MFFRAAHVLFAAAALSLVVFVGPPQTSAAQVQSSALPDADLWSVGFLPQEDKALPREAWAKSDVDDLLTLTRNTRTRKLSPAERILMRRLILSPAIAPDNAKSDDLLAERARLMFQIGEASAAAQLLPTLKKAPIGLDAEEVAVDLQLAIGQTEAACLSGAEREGVFWTKLRAVCFALDDNTAEAELAMELAAAQGVNDAWLNKAIFAASGALPTKPEARYESGLSLAISAKAGLEPSINSIANSRLDLAAAIARLNTFSPAMRVQAAGVAAEAGLLDGGEHRELYKALIATEEFSPRTPLEVALKTTLTPDNDSSAKARALRAALRTARGNIGRYAAVSRLLIEDIEELPVVPGNARMALDFAGAALAGGDPDAAAKWSDLGRKDNAFQAIWTDGLIYMARGENDEIKAAAIAEELIQEARGDTQTAAVHRLFVLWNGLDITLTPAARMMLISARPTKNQSSVRSVSPLLIEALEAGAKSGAGAEVVLQTLKLVSGDAYRLAPRDVADLIGALRALGQEDVARIFALEATGYWRQSL